MAGLGSQAKIVPERGMRVSKKGIKVKELAGELGVTSRTIIDRCREGGLSVQNSVSRLDRGAERTVRAWFEVATDGPASDQTAG